MTAAHEAGARPAPCSPASCSPAPNPPAPPPPAPSPPDWRRAAELLARGKAVAATARQTGCSRSQLSRKRNHDPRFRGWIEEFKEAGLSPEDRLVSLRDAVHKAIETAVGKGNVRVVLWLADRLKLVTPPTERTPGQELQEILSGLSPAELREFESLRDTP